MQLTNINSGLAFQNMPIASTSDAVYPKKSFKEKTQKAKENFLTIIRTFNDVKGTTQGVVRGAADGLIAGTVIGVMGKNIKQADGKIYGTLKGIFKDSIKVVFKAVKHIPDIITKSPLENMKKIIGLPKSFYANYITKNNELTTTLSVLGALSVFALRALQGKMNANKVNSDVDHYTNSGHSVR